MRHRASLMNGELTIEAVPGGGTRVTCSVPAEGVDAD
jgi:signal transduction histidine kinase